MPEIQVQGLAELRRALLTYPKKIQKRALDKAMAAGARVVAAEARKNAPVRSNGKWSGGQITPAGATRANIVAKRGQRRYAGGSDSYFIVGVRHGKTNTNPVGRDGRKRTVTAYDKRGQDPFYWRFQEFGYTAVGRAKALSGAKKRRRVRPTGRYIPGKFFMTRALSASSGAALEKIRAVLEQEIAKL